MCRLSTTQIIHYTLLKNVVIFTTRKFLASSYNTHLDLSVSIETSCSGPGMLMDSSSITSEWNNCVATQKQCTAHFSAGVPWSLVPPCTSSFFRLMHYEQILRRILRFLYLHTKLSQNILPYSQALYISYIYHSLLISFHELFESEAPKIFGEMIFSWTYTPAFLPSSFLPPLSAVYEILIPIPISSTASEAEIVCPVCSNAQSTKFEREESFRTLHRVNT